MNGSGKRKFSQKAILKSIPNEDIVYASMKIRGDNMKVLTRTKSVTTGGLSRETAR